VNKHTHTSTHTHARTHARTHTHAHTHTHTQTHTHTHTDTHTHTHTHKQPHTHTRPRPLQLAPKGPTSPGPTQTVPRLSLTELRKSLLTPCKCLLFALGGRFITGWF